MPRQDEARTPPLVSMDAVEEWQDTPEPTTHGLGSALASINRRQRLMKGDGTVSRDVLDLGRSTCVDYQVGHFCKFGANIG